MRRAGWLPPALNLPLGGGGMVKLLLKLIYKLGMLAEERDRRRSSYTPRYDGQWVNKGTDKDEKWVWIDKVKSIRTYYVNVFQLENDYIITIGYQPRANAIETVDCSDLREAEIALKYLKTYYETLGNVIINSDIG